VVIEHHALVVQDVEWSIGGREPDEGFRFILFHGLGQHVNRLGVPVVWTGEKAIVVEADVTLGRSSYQRNERIENRTSDLAEHRCFPDGVGVEDFSIERILGSG
jgi:hypothetical protein